MEKKGETKQKRPQLGKRWVMVLALIAFGLGITVAVLELPSSLLGLPGKLMEMVSGPEAEAEEDISEEETEAAAHAPAISASGAILINAADGMVLYESNADEKLYPASTTKIMTALVTLETCKELHLPLDSEIIVPAEAQGVEGSSLYLKKGERVTLEELLYGLMLQSGNDSAVALAACIGGAQENFIDMMNEKAKELGCTNTHFTNPNGLFDKEHYTTARDLAIIAKEAMKDENFREIVAAKKWSSATEEEEAETEGSEDKKSSPRSFVNKNKTVFQYEGGNGIKIGFTKASGRTLVASAKRGELELIAVVLRDSNWFQDAYGLMDFGFELLKEEAGI
jgi:D-alanyl-D-alanine carboxypeptidase (penicillin-binding protein 5/6)